MLLSTKAEFIYIASAGVIDDTHARMSTERERERKREMDQLKLQHIKQASSYRTDLSTQYFQCSTIAHIPNPSLGRETCRVACNIATICVQWG